MVSFQESFAGWCSLKAIHLQGLREVKQFLQGVSLIPGVVCASEMAMMPSKTMRNFCVDTSLMLFLTHLYNFPPYQREEAYIPKTVVEID